jgi:cardiolipin synthase
MIPLLGGCFATGRMDAAATAHAAPPAASPRAARAIEALVRRTGDTLLERHVADTEQILGTRIFAGNSVRLLVDGPQTHAQMFASIAAARDHINLVSYIIDDDETGARLADALIDRRRAGIVVNLMYDSVGSMATPTAWFDRLRDAGISVCEFNPVNPSRLRRAWQVNNRDHRKILVVDGTTGFAGGVNVSDVYAAGSFGPARRRDPGGMPWRDTHVMVQGPAVADLQRSFVDRWAQQRCTHLGDTPRYFPEVAIAGPLPVRVVTGGPERATTDHFRALLSAFENAEQRIFITCAYFVPDPAMRDALLRAARRGVEVRLLLPSVSDFWAPLEAGRSHYAALLAAGVRVHERTGALLHAKTAVVDGVWSTIGSTNLDFRSLLHNEEVNVIVFDDRFAAELEGLFARDLDLSTEITIDEWARRGLAPRLRQWFARQCESLL